MDTEKIIERLLKEGSITVSEAMHMMRELLLNRYVRHDDSISKWPEKVPAPSDVQVKYGIRTAPIAVAYGVSPDLSGLWDTTADNICLDTEDSSNSIR